MTMCSPTPKIFCLALLHIQHHTEGLSSRWPSHQSSVPIDTYSHHRYLHVWTTQHRKCRCVDWSPPGNCHSVRLWRETPAARTCHFCPVQHEKKHHTLLFYYVIIYLLRYQSPLQNEFYTWKIKNNQRLDVIGNNELAFSVRIIFSVQVVYSLQRTP